MSTLFSVSLRIVGGLVCLGIFTNSTCLFVMFRHRRKLMVLDSCRFLANQSLIDLLVNVTVVISSAVLQYGADDLKAGTVLHAILCFSMRVLFETSTINLVVTVLEKYIKVVHPIRHRNHVNARVINGMLVFPWIFSLTSVALQTGGQTVSRADGTCYYNLPTPWRYVADLWAFLINYFLPMTALIVCHVMMFNKLKKRRVGVTTASASTAQMRRTTNNTNQPQVTPQGPNQPQVQPQGPNQPQVPSQGPNQPQVPPQGPNQPQVPLHNQNQLQVPTQRPNQPQVLQQGQNQLQSSNKSQVPARNANKPAENRIIRVVFTVSMVFVFSYTVYFITVFTSFVVGLKSVERLFLLAGILATTNVVINPCIYVMQFKQFRESFFEMMTSVKCW